MTFPISFAALFEPDEGESVPGYLDLLGMMDGEAALRAFAKIQTGVKTSNDLSGDIAALLVPEEGWRPHLVGAVALTFAPRTPKGIEALWRAFDAGSWVTPQLAACALICDPDFEQQAQMRTQPRRPPQAASTRSKLGDLSAHVILGPSNWAKSLGALIGILRANPPPWLAELEQIPEIHSLLDADPDNGAGLATSWLETFKLRLREFRAG